MNTVSIHIRADVLSAVGAQARRESPNECCGLLIGTADLIDQALPAANLLASASRYQLDPRIHFETNRQLRGTPRAVIGSYHSHPRSAAIPSPRDIAEAHYPEFVWLIVSLETAVPTYRAWRINHGAAGELALIVER